MPEEKKNYIVLRRDGLVVHTVPLTEDEAWLLYREMYYAVKSRRARARYLAEYGNVLDVAGFAEQQLKRWGYNPYYNVIGVYEDPEEFEESAGRLLRRRGLPPEARQAVKELAGEIGEFLQRPVEPRPVEAPVRYYEVPDLLVAPRSGAVMVKPEWHVHEDACCGELYYGISVFRDVVWLWRQEDPPVRIIVVRRDVSDKDVVAALVNDDDVMSFLREYGNVFRYLMREREKELIDNGYDDVVRKVKVILTTLDLLSAGRREEALPA